MLNCLIDGQKPLKNGPNWPYLSFRFASTSFAKFVIFLLFQCFCMDFMQKFCRDYQGSIINRFCMRNPRCHGCIFDFDFDFCACFGGKMDPYQKLAHYKDLLCELLSRNHDFEIGATVFKSITGVQLLKYILNLITLNMDICFYGIFTFKNTQSMVIWYILISSKKI